VDEIAADDDEERELPRRIAQDARAYLEDHAWCEHVVELRVGDGIGGIVPPREPFSQSTGDVNGSRPCETVGHSTSCPG
jgi:hypothetical protein